MTITIVGPTSWRDALAQTVHPVWRRIRPPTLLEKLLRDYPPYFVPHPGDAYQLSTKQRHENLAYFLENKSQRLHNIAALLAEYDLDLSPVLDATQDPKPFFELLNEWAWNEWDKLPNIEKLTEHDNYQLSKKDHRDTPLSMLFDVSILLGESMVLRHPILDWALDDDRGSRQMQTMTWGRIVVFWPRDRERDIPWLSLDVEAATMWNCNNMARNRFFRAAVSAKGIQLVAMQAIEGGWDRFRV